MGSVGILNVGAGDTKLIFDNSNPAECIRAARIVADMIRRGYALLVEVERDGVKKFQRIKEFKEDTCEYIIADFDPIKAAEADQEEGTHEETQEAPVAAAAPPRQYRQKADRKIPASSTRAIAVPRTSGG